MMTRCTLALLAAILLGLPATAAAQSSLSCTYDECALRQQGPHLVAGVGARRTLRVGVFGTRGLAALVAHSDSAAAYAARYQRRQQNSAALGILSGLGTLGALYTMGRYDGGSSNTVMAPVILLGSAAAGLLAGLEATRARDDLARTVWWYNRSLAR